MSNPQASRHRETILAIVTGLLILFLIFRKDWLLYAGAATGLAGLFSTTAATWIDWAWGKLTRGIGFVNAHLLLGVVFFIILFPIALIYRLFSKDPMQLKPGKDSYYRERNHQYEAGDLEKPW